MFTTRTRALGIIAGSKTVSQARVVGDSHLADPRANITFMETRATRAGLYLPVAAERRLAQ